MNASIAASAYHDTDLLENSSLSVWRSFKNGNPGALEQIYAKYFDLLCLYGRQFAPDNQSLVEDCLQDLFIQLFTNPNKEQLSDTTSIKYYLMKSLRRLIINRRKSEMLCRKREEYIPNAETGYSIEMFADSNAQNELLAEFIQQLSPRQREAIYMRFIAGLDFPQIATKLDLTVKSVYKLIYKALANLKEMYRNHGTPDNCHEELVHVMQG